MPINFTGISANGRLSFADVSGTRVDDLRVYGTAESNIFRVNSAGDARLVSLAAGAGENVKLIPVLTPGVANLQLNGLDGDDAFEVAGNHPFTTGMLVDGGDPSASDVLSFTSSGGDVTVDLAGQTVREGGFGAVSFPGVEVLNVNAGPGTLTVLGRATAETLNVTPTGANTTTIVPSDLNLTINTTSSGALNINALGGSDNLAIFGTQIIDAITVTGTLVAVGPFKTVNYSGTENLQVFGQAGSDTFNVTPAAGTSIFLDGGDPIGVLPGDHINIAGPVSINVGPENDEGSLETGGQPVSFDHIESITVNGGGAGGNVLNGTNGNDAITIIARDASTHAAAGANGVQDFTVSINNGPELLFIDTAAITVNALAGDDEITVRTPAPNDALWNVQVLVNGGASTAGDNVILETPFLGPETAAYLPTGLNSGDLILTDHTSTVRMLDVEDVLYNGMQDGDSLTVTTPNAIITQGTFAGSGLIEPFDAVDNPLLKLSYLNVNGSVSISGTAAVIQGTAGDDIISVSLAGIVTVSNSNNVVQNTFNASGLYEPGHQRPGRQ